MTSEKPIPIQQIAEFSGVSIGTIYKWIKAGKLKATKQGKTYEVLFSENDKFLLAQLKKKHSKPQLAWTPKEIEDYSEWHELIDEICWLIKICYSSKDDIKHKLFRLDRLFVNYLTFHKVTLNKVRQVFGKLGLPDPCGCFTAGTQVYTDKGYKNIEDIKVEDLVWAYNEKTKNQELKKVINTFSKVRNHIYKIHFGNNVIEATEDHPFFIDDQWLKVKNLKVGDLLNLYGRLQLQN